MRCEELPINALPHLVFFFFIMNFSHLFTWHLTIEITIFLFVFIKKTFDILYPLKSVCLTCISPKFSRFYFCSPYSFIILFFFNLERCFTKFTNLVWTLSICMTYLLTVDVHPSEFPWKPNYSWLTKYSKQHPKRKDSMIISFEICP